MGYLLLNYFYFYFYLIFNLILWYIFIYFNFIEILLIKITLSALTCYHRRDLTTQFIQRNNGRLIIPLDHCDAVANYQYYCVSTGLPAAHSIVISFHCDTVANYKYSVEIHFNWVGHNKEQCMVIVSFVQYELDNYCTWWQIFLYKGRQCNQSRMQVYTVNLKKQTKPGITKGMHP